MRYLYLAIFILWVAAVGAQDSAHTAADTSCHCNVSTPPVHTFSNLQLYSSLSPLPGDADSAHPNTLSLDIDFHMNSNAVMATFAGAFLTQGTITDAMKGRVLSYAHRTIKYEDELKAGLAYEHYFKKPAVQIYVSYFHRNLRTLTTSRDAFELVFDGNKPFENKTADLSNINFLDLMYNQYSIGFSKSDGHFKAGINLSYLQGFNSQQLKNPNGSLYTAPYGEYIDLSYNMVLNEATPGSAGFFDLNGQGVSADLKIEYNAERTRFSLSVQDLGYIAWHRHPVNYSGDTAIHYSGVAIANVTNITSGGLGGINLDSVVSALSPHRTNQSYNTTLPATIQATFSQYIKLRRHDMILTAGVNTRLMAGYYAYGYVKTTFLLGHQWSTSASAGAGGYSLFNLGFDVGRRWKNLDLLLGSNNLIGSLLPMYYPGCSVYLRVAARF